jgi:thiol:disulfide interchange protein DsbC
MTRPAAGIFPILLLAFLATALLPGRAPAFMKDGCGSGNCIDCHALTAPEAAKVLKPLELDNVLHVSESPVKGLWSIEVEKGGARGTIFLDYGKKHVMQAQIVRLDNKENVTGVRRVDPSKIPLGNALTLGKPDAPKQVVVFSDPDCHFCGNLHKAIHAVVEGNPDVAFRIVLFSRSNDPATVKKVRSILCAKSMPLLDNAYLGLPLPEPACESGAAEENARIAADLGIAGTPALVMPDGRLLPGAREADSILRLLKEDEKLAPKPAAH